MTTTPRHPERSRGTWAAGRLDESLDYAPDDVWDYDSDARRTAAAEELGELARNSGVIAAFVARDIKIRYRRSVLGALWSLAGPLLMMVVLTLAFSNVFATHAPAFPAFVLPGLLLWNFFTNTVTVVVGEASSGLDLWRRARIPKTAPAISTTITGLLHLAIALVPLIAIELILGRPFNFALATVPLAMLLAALFTLGFALIGASIALYLPDASHISGIALSAWMFITPVIYPMSILPPRIQRLIEWNPMTWLVAAFRDPFYLGTTPSITAYVAMFGGSVLLVAIGWLLFTRNAREACHRG